ncbi:DUF4286 family protein [Capnocytophaga bilenii]|uniref:DUF4286 family protein n=1 Tax=Capnocytophaga bilenii TaxID=2819369 RepID=UPI0028D523E0|nr:DUF4286 family protein [Capnocytophaga bilenii]
MYVYNLTAVVEQSVLADWQEWFATVYEPTLAAQEGLKVRVYKVLGAEEAQFAIHHEMSTTSDLQEFVKGQLQALVNQASKRFGEKVLFFGTALHLNKEF